MTWDLKKITKKRKLPEHPFSSQNNTRCTLGRLTRWTCGSVTVVILSCEYCVVLFMTNIKLLYYFKSWCPVLRWGGGEKRANCAKHTLFKTVTKLYFLAAWKAKTKCENVWVYLTFALRPSKSKYWTKAEVSKRKYWSWRCFHDFQRRNPTIVIKVKLKLFSVLIYH